MVPAGYPYDGCKTLSAPKNALAQVSCEQNSDAGGPQSATYTLVADKTALEAAFNDIVQAVTTVNCPGNIQSPGPWRRNATPDKISGVLFCGVRTATQPWRGPRGDTRGQQGPIRSAGANFRRVVRVVVKPLVTAVKC